MQRLAFSGLSSGLDRLRPLRGSDQVPSRVASAAVRSSGAITYGSFMNLKLTAQKLVKEQASAKAELDMAVVRKTPFPSSIGDLFSEGSLDPYAFD